MLQEESIYNLVPKMKIVPGRGASYRSRYPPDIAPTASTFILQNSSFPGVANMSGEYKFPRGAHPILRNSATFGLPLGGYSPDPLNFHKKGETHKIYPPTEKLHTYSDIKNTNHEFLKPEDIFIMFFSKVYNINISDIDNFLSERGVKGTHLSTYSEYDEPMTFEEMIVVFKDINENNEDKEHDIYHVVKSVYENENLITIIVNCYNYLLDISPFLSTYFKENIVKQPFVNKIKTLYKQFEPLTIKPKNFVIGKNIIANIFEISGNKLDFFIDCYIDNTEYYLNLKEIKECDKETEELNTEKNNLTPITFLNLSIILQMTLL